MNFSDNIKYIGVNDHDIDLFEGQYAVPLGMSYNSYVIIDEKIAVMDSVDKHFSDEWLTKLEAEIGDRKPDYIVVQHMEPDHSSSLMYFVNKYPEVTVVASSQAFNMMKNFFGENAIQNKQVVKEGDTLDLGEHHLSFIQAPMVHWPEVIMTYEGKEKVLFSADGFGKFGALDVEDEWECEARRYYFGIVGKFGQQVQNVLKKAAGLDIATICPLHGPVLTENLDHYIDLYNTWSSYGVESEGVAVCYTSVYGNTKEAVEYLVDQLEAKGVEVHVSDLARDDMAEALEDAFRYGKLVLATTTYNADMYPFMKDFINHLVDHAYQNRKIALIENGTWAPMANKKMHGMLDGLKNIEFYDDITILSHANGAVQDKLDALAEELSK